MKCPKCGQPLTVGEGQDFVECFICKTKVPIAKPASKPQSGYCIRCRSTNLTFNDDGTGRCNSCGRTFRWDSKERVKQMQVPQPVCIQCGSPYYLQYFPRGKAVCNYCRKKMKWEYDVYGRFILREPTELEKIEFEF